MKFNANTKLNRFLLGFLSVIIKLLFKTCRVQANIPRHHAAEKGGISATWHRGVIFLLYYFRYLGKYAVIVSQSRDGDLLAQFIKKMNAVPVRGSSSRGGLKALKEMLDLIKAGQIENIGTPLDGPRGPRYQAKIGMIYLSSRSGLPLFPMLWSADRRWVFRKSWDHTVIPKPFAKVWLEVGEPIYYPPKMDKEEMEKAAHELSVLLYKKQKELDIIAGYQEPGE